MSNRVNTIELRRWDSNEVIFSYECEDNTFKKTFNEAIARKIKLTHLDARGQDLSNENLKSLDLSIGNYSGCDFSNSRIESVNFSYCDLTDCRFYNAELVYVKIQGAIIDDIKLLVPTIDWSTFYHCTCGHYDVSGVSYVNMRMDFAEFYSLALEKISRFHEEPMSVGSIGYGRPCDIKVCVGKSNRVRH